MAHAGPDGLLPDVLRKRFAAIPGSGADDETPLLASPARLRLAPAKPEPGLAWSGVRQSDRPSRPGLSSQTKHALNTYVIMREKRALTPGLQFFSPIQNTPTSRQKSN